MRRGILRNKLFLLIIIITTAICLSSLGLVRAFAATNGTDEQDTNSLPKIMVMTGDTLWGIAMMYKPEGMDPREYIEDVKEINDKKVSSIQAGEELILPQYDGS